MQPFQKDVSHAWDDLSGDSASPLAKLLHASLLERNPSDQDMKTCAQWYALDKSCDIRDPDGFNRKSTGSSAFWCFVPVGETYYSTRVSRCSTGSYMAYNHAQPFGCSTRDEQTMDELEEHPLGSLILKTLRSPHQ
jgi:hypothetical protein